MILILRRRIKLTYLYLTLFQNTTMTANDAEREDMDQVQRDAAHQMQGGNSESGCPVYAKSERKKWIDT